MFLVYSNFQFLSASREGRSYLLCFGIVVDMRRPKFSPSQMQLAPSIGMLHRFVLYFLLQIVKEGDMAAFFLQDLGLALPVVAKPCAHQPQVINKARHGQALP